MFFIVITQNLTKRWLRNQTCYYLTQKKLVSSWSLLINLVTHHAVWDPLSPVLSSSAHFLSSSRHPPVVMFWIQHLSFQELSFHCKNWKNGLCFPLCFLESKSDPLPRSLQGVPAGSNGQNQVIHP